MNRQRNLLRAAFCTFLLVFALAGQASIKVPLGTTADGIEASDFQWIYSLAVEGKTLEEFNFRVSIGNHRTNSIQNLQLRLFFYDEQEQPLTNLLVKCLARIPAGGKTSIDGYVDSKIEIPKRPTGDPDQRHGKKYRKVPRDG